MERRLHNSCCIVGKFESFHLGHQQLIKRAKEFCAKVVVISINKFSPPLLFSERERELLAQHLGVKLLNLNYETIKDLSPEEFFEFLKKLNCEILLAGKDWRFGRGRKGDILLAKKLGEEFGIKVLELPLIEVEGRKVSTSLIKEHLRKGNLEKANQLLGFPYFTLGETVKGKGMGKKLGFPTINLKPEKVLLLPFGVYEVEVSIGGKKYRGIANYGVRPTFGEGETLLEVHVVDEELPEIQEGEEVKVEFLRFLRREKKFSNLEELKKQIKFDVENLKRFWRESFGRAEEV